MVIPWKTRDTKTIAKAAVRNRFRCSKLRGMPTTSAIGMEPFNPPQKTMCDHDPGTDARFKYPDIAREEGLCSLLSVPMLMGEKVIGVLNCYTKQEKTFQEKDIQLLVTISNQAAIAIEHVNLLDEQIRLKESIEARKIVERAKGILMKRCNISEDEAYRFIQKKSMDNNKPLKEVAEALLLAEELKPF